MPWAQRMHNADSDYAVMQVYRVEKESLRTIHIGWSYGCAVAVRRVSGWTFCLPSGLLCTCNMQVGGGVHVSRQTDNVTHWPHVIC